jgi:aminopeptidase N
LEEYSYANRSGVITEPSKLDEVKICFSDLEKHVNAAEAYMGTPYIWTNYRILVLPSSFPYGGMENPLLTFASPTIVTPDKS